MTRKIDFDSLPENKSIIFQAIVSDGVHQDTTSVQINITNVSDMRPSCDPASLAINISEKAAVDEIIAELSCFDDDRIIYNFSTGNINLAFKFAENRILVGDDGAGTTSEKINSSLLIY